MRSSSTWTVCWVTGASYRAARRLLCRSLRVESDLAGRGVLAPRRQDPAPALVPLCAVLHLPRPAPLRLRPGIRRYTSATMGVPMRSLPLPQGARLRPTLSRVCGLRRRTLRGGVHRGAVAAGLVVALASAAVLAAPLVRTTARAGAQQHPTDPPAAQRPGLALVQAGSAPVSLAPASGAPAPPPPEVANVALRPHEVFGFAPYWTLDQSPRFDLRSLSTLAYFGVDALPDGTVASSGDGWTGYQSDLLASLITRAHQSGVRVVLTVKNFSNPDLHALATT